MKNAAQKIKTKILTAAAALVLLALAAPALASNTFLAAEISQGGFEFNQYSVVSMMSQNVTIRVRMPGTLPFQMVHDGDKSIAVIL